MKFRQHDRTDCGAACLAFVAHYFRLQVSIAAIRRRAGTGKDGTTALGLVDAAVDLGFNAKGAKCAWSELGKLPLPAIVHVHKGGAYHFIVLSKIFGKTIKVMDPAIGREEVVSLASLQEMWTNVVILIAPAAEFVSGQPSRSRYGRLLDLLLPKQAMLTEAFCGAVAVTLLSLSTTIFVQKIMDNVIVDGNDNLLTLMGVLMLGVLAVRLTLSYLQGILLLRIAQQIDSSLIFGYYQHLLRLPQRFFDTMRIGEITARVSDAVRIRQFLNSTLLNMLLNPLILGFSLGGMFFYSKTLALVSLGIVPVNVAIFFISAMLNRGYQRSIMERNAEFQAQLVESISAISLVRAFGLQDHMQAKTEGHFVRLLKTVWRSARVSLGFTSAGTAVTQTYLILLLWIGAREVLDHQLTLGGLMSCYTLGSYFSGPLTNLLGMIGSAQEALIAVDRLFDIIDEKTEDDSGGVRFAPESIKEISIQDVTFSYPGRLPVLRNVSTSIPTGQITLFMGASGSGKSTLLQLLQRNYVQGSGRIMMGATDLRYFSLTSLRANLAVVSQETLLLSGSVIENIAPAGLEPDLAKAASYAKVVGIYDFIESLPDGFNTQLEENGTNLSGGQRQRLALVRALYSDAPLLLLDEPTSSLDPESEARVFDALVRQRDAGRSIVISCHNRTALSIADQIVYFDKGSCELRSSDSVGQLKTDADLHILPACRWETTTETI